MEMMIRNGIILMEITNSVISAAAAAIRDPGFFCQLPRAKAFNNTTDDLRCEDECGKLISCLENPEVQLFNCKSTLSFEMHFELL